MATTKATTTTWLVPRISTGCLETHTASDVKCNREIRRRLCFHLNFVDWLNGRFRSVHAIVRQKKSTKYCDTAGHRIHKRSNNWTTAKWWLVLGAAVVDARPVGVAVSRTTSSRSDIKQTQNYLIFRSRNVLYGLCDVHNTSQDSFLFKFKFFTFLFYSERHTQQNSKWEIKT